MHHASLPAAVTWAARQHLACLLAAALLAGCSVQVNDLSQPLVGHSQNATWPAPAVGRFLCLSVDPGLPVMQHPGGGPVIGYTREVVAFYGNQGGHYVSIVHYTGALGWIDGMRMRPFHGARPGSMCIVPGVDLQQRPMFVIT